MCMWTVFNHGNIVLAPSDPFVTFPMQSELLYLVMETGPVSYTPEYILCFEGPKVIFKVC